MRTLKILEVYKRQMGTKQEVLEVQKQIKNLSAEIGWTQNRLAQILYTELHVFDDPDEILKFQERLKKELVRPTTKIERLRVYLDLIIAHPEAKKVDRVFNKYIPQEAISASLRKGMIDISQSIDQEYDRRHLISEQSPYSPS